MRERNAFVSVRRDDLARALAALNGASLAGKQAVAEQARERGAEGEPQGDAPAPAAGVASVASVVEAPHTAPLAATDEAAEAIEESVPTGRSGV